MRRLFAFALACSIAAAAWGQTVSLRGHVGADTRIYLRGAAFDGQERAPFSLLAEPRLRAVSADRRKEFLFIPYLRESAGTTERGGGDIRDLYGAHHGDGWSALVGVSRVFWGAAESLHMIDIVNQSDLAEDYRGHFKLGQPMAMLTLTHPYGQFELLALPGFRERRFAPARSRPRLALPVLADAAYPDGKGADWAARVTFSHDRVDAHLYHFAGLSREPDFLPVFDGEGRLSALRPSYRRIRQTGLDLTYALDALILKGEFLDRRGYSRGFTAGVAGAEYVFGAGASGADRSLFVEHLFDQRPADAPPALFRRGWFVGGRLAANDADSSEIRGGVVFDTDSGARTIRVEASRRIRDDWQLHLEYNGFAGVGGSASLASFADDSYLRILIRRNF
ncbi:MAG: hypothetical protein KDH15_00795 [Rhodocyclaceae bacterium]|nr:hypothetical protein [Rhodocyclaceae bacterium]